MRVCTWSVIKFEWVWVSSSIRMNVRVNVSQKNMLWLIDVQILLRLHHLVIWTCLTVMFACCVPRWLCFWRKLPNHILLVKREAHLQNSPHLTSVWTFTSAWEWLAFVLIGDPVYSPKFCFMPNVEICNYYQGHMFEVLCPCQHNVQCTCSVHFVQPHTTVQVRCCGTGTSTDLSIHPTDTQTRVCAIANTCWGDILEPFDSLSCSGKSP